MGIVRSFTEPNASPLGSPNSGYAVRYHSPKFDLRQTSHTRQTLVGPVRLKVEATEEVPDTAKKII